MEIMYKFCFTLFSIEVLSFAAALVSDGQLSDFMTSIWNSDHNAARRVRVNLQGHTYYAATSDRASTSLFSYKKDHYYLSRPTYAALNRLLDNYNHVVGGAEHSNYEEDHEVTSFLDAISKTSVMQKTLQFLHKHGYVESTWSSLETQLRRVWFECYPRFGQVTDSSGFEHVFVGETNSTEVIGFHNWIQFHLQEKKGNLHYLGYIFSKQPNILGAHFRWLSATKYLGTFMYSASPEFDISMYTICFFARRNEKCNFSVNGHKIQIKTYDISHEGGEHLATAYILS